MSIVAAPAITPYDQDVCFEVGRDIGKIDREWGVYDPPPTAKQNAAMLQGYDRGWIEQEMIMSELSPATDQEAQFELDSEALDAW